jgi:hypothetical protein
MNRIQFIEDFGPVEPFGEKRSLFAAFVASLTPAEACSVLDLNFEQELPKRRAVLRKIAQDLQAGVQECHCVLLQALFNEFEGLPYKIRSNLVLIVLAICAITCQTTPKRRS